ncbi:MAG TPA: VOC family protein [Catenuloplanes sp.]|jgi:catechol 2,3-dioxygenase-like lactoylglutathione lyase family enzyme
MIGRLHNTVIDCPDPRALASFYCELLGWYVVRDSGDWVVIGADSDAPGIAFQQAPDLREPHWPDPERPQQFHLDVLVDDIEAAEAKVLAIGASRLPGKGDDFRVYADPAGHPFCLVWD